MATDPKVIDNPRQHLGLLADSCLIATSRFLTGGDKARRLNSLTARNLEDPERYRYEPSKDFVSYAELHGLMAGALRSARVMDKEVIRLLDGNLDWWHGMDQGRLIPGLRYARNVVEHERAELVRLGGLGREGVERGVIWDLTWEQHQATRSGRYGEAEYGEHFAGQPIATVLAALNPPLLSGALEALRIGPRGLVARWVG